MSFMAQPSEVLKSYVQLARVSENAYKLGMLGMALEIVTRIRVLESLPITTEVGRQEAIVCLHTMLQELGIEEETYEWYDKLSEWRKPKFRRDGDVLDHDALASAAVTLRGVRALGDSTDGSASERPRYDPAGELTSGSSEPDEPLA